MSIDFQYFDEPMLRFGSYFEHPDAKTGLAEFGPFGKSVPGLHRRELHIGFVGTHETISGTKEWLSECSLPIESQNIKTIVESNSGKKFPLFSDDSIESKSSTQRIQKILNRDFIGFSTNTNFESCFQTNPLWERLIQLRELNSILDGLEGRQRVNALVELFDAQIESIAKTDPSPDIILISLTNDIYEKAHTVRISGNFYLDFRRALKAKAMKWGIPIQILRRSTVVGKGANLQEKATRAWNFCTAQYYKAGGIPWCPVGLEQDTCYIGVSFYVSSDIDDQLTIRSSVTQAFDHLGQGLVLRGEPFEWNEDRLGKSPHLTRKDSAKLIRDTLTEYVKVVGRPPRRVVVHKTSKFWGKERHDFNEVEGFQEGIDSVFSGCHCDLVSIAQTGVRLFREGDYPPLRGTYFTIDNTEHFLCTAGYIPYLETYPGSYVPEPWHLIDWHGGSSPKDLLREILLLTKLNMNNCSFADGTPITISFSRRIGEILKHVSEDGPIQPRYKFYM